MGRSRVNDEQLREAAETSQNLVQVLRRVGLVPCGGNYAIVRGRLERLGLLHARFAPRPLPVRIRFDAVPLPLLEAAVASSSTFADVRRRSPTCSERSGGRSTSATTGHSGGSWLRTACRRRTSRAGAGPGGSGDRGHRWGEVLVAGRPTASALGRRLVDEGVLPRRCSRCLREDWQGKLIPLELDHVNGDRDDNRLENLRLLCPNCHALTDT